MRAQNELPEGWQAHSIAKAASHCQGEPHCCEREEKESEVDMEELPELQDA